MDSGSSLPAQHVPHDALRQGLAALKQDAEQSHPVEAIQNNRAQQQEQARYAMLQNLYGSALPARIQIEKQILSRVQRLPGLPSSRVSYEAMTGDLDVFALESYVGNAAEHGSFPAVRGPDLHSQMEARRGGPSVTRGVF